MLIHIISQLYFLSILVLTIISGIFYPSLLSHGRKIDPLNLGRYNIRFFKPIAFLHNIRLSKKYYFLFYLVPMIIYLGTDGSFPRSLLLIFYIRRFIETLLYSRNSKSKMTIIQFIHGIIYYIFVSLNIQDNNRMATWPLIYLLNLIQLVAHIRLYKLSKYEFFHYYSEIAYYFVLFYYIGSLSLLLNCMYVIAFTLISIKMRVSRVLK